MKILEAETGRTSGITSSVTSASFTVTILSKGGECHLHIFPAIGIYVPKRISFRMWSFHNKKPRVKTQIYNPFG